jgi:hypothetical protein
MTGVGRALKSKKLTPKFIGPYAISERIGTVAYRVGLPPHLSNLHDVFHVSQLRKYIADPSHVIPIDDVQVRDNLTVSAGPSPVQAGLHIWASNLEGPQNSYFPALGPIQSYFISVKKKAQISHV